jgi:hypothetical protein
MRRTAQWVFAAALLATCPRRMRLRVATCITYAPPPPTPPPPPPRSEDPLHLSAYAVEFVKGFEHAKEDNTRLQASACCKHFVGNSLEAWNGTDRYHVDLTIADRDLYDSYLPAFSDCVTKSQISSVMCSYNAVNGVPSCANDWLLQTLLRDTWEVRGSGTTGVFFNATNRSSEPPPHISASNLPPPYLLRSLTAMSRPIATVRLVRRLRCGSVHVL